MPLKKLSDPPKICNDPNHDPPPHIVLENGTYEYECPSCGHKVIFTVSRPTF